MKALNRSFPRADPARWARPKPARLRDQPIFAFTQEIDVAALRDLFQPEALQPGRINRVLQPPIELPCCSTMKRRPVLFISHAPRRTAR